MTSLLVNKWSVSVIISKIKYIITFSQGVVSSCLFLKKLCDKTRYVLNILLNKAVNHFQMGVLLSGLKKFFQTSHMAELIKILFEFTRVGRKKSNSLKAWRGGGGHIQEGVIMGYLF